MRFTCRNLNTGKYLAVCESEIDGQQGNFLCSTSDSSILEEQTLVFEPASASALRKQGGEEFVNDECAVFINAHSPIILTFCSLVIFVISSPSTIVACSMAFADVVVRVKYKRLSLGRLLE